MSARPARCSRRNETLKYACYRPQGSWGKVIFSKASVILSTGGGVLSQHPLQVVSQHALQGVLSQHALQVVSQHALQGEVPGPGGVCSGGVCLGGAWSWGVPGPREGVPAPGGVPGGDTPDGYC